MNRLPIYLQLLLSFLLLLHCGNGISAVVEDGVKHSLIGFLAKLNGSTTGKPDVSFGWVESTDPCLNSWLGISCDFSNKSITRIDVSGLDLSGSFDPSSVCNSVSSLNLINLQKNQLAGEIPEEISNCTNLTHLLIGKNNFSGRIPDSIVEMKNLNKLDLSHNVFSGNLPDLTRLPELTVFTAQGNHFTGQVPSFNFSKLEKFDISHNNFSGQIPDVKRKFSQNCFQDNPELCGPPLPKPCLSSNIVSSESDHHQVDEKKTKSDERDQILMYSGYTIVGFGVVVSFFMFWMCKRKRSGGMRNKKGDFESRVASVDDSFLSKESSSHVKESRSEYSEMTGESGGLVSSSLVVLTSPLVSGLDFEELLKAPAELLGRGKHGSLYKVNLNSGMTVVVKRVKDWPISSGDFKQRMQRVHQVSHPNVLPTLAFYCSGHEKLLVYGYQENGSLFRYLHGTKMGQAFDWGSRLTVAATIAEALSFMHKNLYDDSISHGNLKSSNILLNQNLEPCVSEYGLMPSTNITADATESSSSSSSEGNNSFSFSEVKNPKINKKKSSLLASDAAFKADVYGFGVILLELLTGKTVQNNGGMSLPTWVQAVVREEWTVEVFDKHLISEGASEERMVNVLQVAIKCTSQSAGDRPTIKQTAVMINAIRDEEERSITTSYSR